MFNRLRHHRPVRSFAYDSAVFGSLARHPAGVRSIPVDAIVGSVGRDRELRADFMPWRRPHGDFRFQQIVQALQWGNAFPPIEVYELNGRYYVVDGNRRVAAALRTGQLEIDAAITVFQPVGAGAAA